MKEFHKFIISDTSFNSFYKRLDLSYDENGLLRCGAAKHPVLLGRRYCFNELVIMDYHAQITRKTFNMLEFWITKRMLLCRNTIESLVCRSNLL